MWKTEGYFEHVAWVEYEWGSAWLLHPTPRGNGGQAAKQGNGDGKGKREVEKRSPCLLDSMEELEYVGLAKRESGVGKGTEVFEESRAWPWLDRLSRKVCEVKVAKDGEKEEEMRYEEYEKIEGCVQGVHVRCVDLGLEETVEWAVGCVLMEVRKLIGSES